MTTAQRGRRGAYRGRRVAPRNRPASSKGQTTRAQRRRTIQLAVAGAIFVLLAMGKDELRATHAVRLSFSHLSTRQEIDFFIRALKEIIDEYATR